MTKKMALRPILHTYKEHPEPDKRKNGCFWCGCRADKHPERAESPDNGNHPSNAVVTPMTPPAQPSGQRVAKL